MEKLEKIQKDLQISLSEERYKHSLGVMKTAEELAKVYGVDSYIASLTGLAHDIAKEIPNEEKLKYIKENNIEIDKIEKNNIGLLHAKIGADITKRKYGFTEEMQNAIKYHTTANPNMDLLSKIIFVADKIEENRKYDGVEEIRQLAKKDINSCIIAILTHDIKKNLDKGTLIHLDSILTRNKLLFDSNLN